jgi:hypothetical protein
MLLGGVHCCYKISIFSLVRAVARMRGNVAYDPSGRYAGTRVDDRLVFQDEDSPTFGPLFVRESHAGSLTLGTHRSERSIGGCYWGE